jgi:hypothetical protein
MTKYGEIKEAAAAGERLFRESKQRCMQYGVLLTNTFASYCEIPASEIRVLRWNGWAANPPFEDAEPGYKFTATGAMKFDEETRSWRFGVRIKVGSLGWFVYGLGVADSNGKALVEVARNQPRLVDLNDENQRNSLYDYIVDVIKDCYRSGTARSGIGFSLPAEETGRMELSPDRAGAPFLSVA